MLDHHAHSAPIEPSSRGAQKAATGTVLKLNFLFFLVVATSSFYANSLVLLASAVHLVADLAGLGVSYASMALATKPASSRHSFGLVRAEVLGALVNGALLLASSMWIIVKAVHDLTVPHRASPLPVVVLGVTGLFVSGVSLFFLWRRSGRSLNMKAGVVHMAGDALGWLITILSGAAIAVFGFNKADSIGSIFISLLVLASSWTILTQTVSVLLESTPRTMAPEEIVTAIKSIDTGVIDVHHLHLWNLASDTVALSAHVLMRDGATLHSAQTKVALIKDMLKSRYGIDHVTVELECHECGDDMHQLES